MIYKKSILIFPVVALVILTSCSSSIFAQEKTQVRTQTKTHVKANLSQKETTRLQANIQTAIANLTKSDTELRTKLSQLSVGINTVSIQAAITDLETQINALKGIQVSTDTSALSSSMKIFQTARLSAQKDIITANQGLKTVIQSSAQITKIKVQGDKAISERITSLNSRIAKITALKNLTTSQKSDFASQFQSRISALTSLKAKINSDTDLATIKIDYQSIFNDNRIFAIFEPKMNIMIQADTIIAKANVLLAKTTDPTVKAKLNNVITQATAAITKVSSLTPTNYPAASILTDAKKLIKLAQTDLNSIKK